MGHFTHVPGAGGLIFAARPAACIVGDGSLAGIDRHRHAATNRHLLQILVESVRHHAVHPFLATGGHRRTVKAVCIRDLGQNQTGRHIATGVPVDAAQPAQGVRHRRVFQPHVKLPVGIQPGVIAVIDIAQTLLVDSAATGIFQPGPATGAGHARIQHAAWSGEKVIIGVVFHENKLHRCRVRPGCFRYRRLCPHRAQCDNKQAYQREPLSFHDLLLPAARWRKFSDPCRRHRRPTPPRAPDLSQARLHSFGYCRR